MASETPETKEPGSEVLATYAEYVAASISLDAVRVARYYHEPFMQVTAAGVLQLKTQADAEAFLKPGLAALKEAGYARTDFPELRAKSLGKGLAMISGKGVRYKTDGTPMVTFGIAYIWRQVAGQWKLAVMTVHEPSGVLPLVRVTLPGSAA